MDPSSLILVRLLSSLNKILTVLPKFELSSSSSFKTLDDDNKPSFKSAFCAGDGFEP